MIWFWRIVIGLIVSALGFFMVWKSSNIVDMMGRSYWAETKFSLWGGTTGLLKIIGMVVIFLGFFILTNLHMDLMAWLVSPFIPKPRS
ncbi:MAG: hypothetical protein AAB570_01295 [Patescibacteria group bacterium]